MAGRSSGSDRTRSYQTTQSTKRSSSSTRRFSTVNSSSRRAQLAREKQKRLYEQQKREKIIFALFVVIILVMILFAILIFKQIVTRDPADTSDPNNVVDTPPEDERGGLLGGRIDQMIAKDQLYQGSLILVDPTSPAKAGATMTDLTQVENRTFLMSGLGKLLEETAAGAFAKMAADEYESTGVKLLVHRCYEEDNKESDLASGLALDVAVMVDGATHPLASDACYDVMAWLTANASDYGFVMMTPEETGRTHYGFRYVGVPHASYMAENKLSLAAYVELLRTTCGIETGSPLSITVDGAEYAVYYVVTMGGDMTTVPVPAGALSHTISGDNSKGYIVTAQMK